jgi:hypothetical protein
MSAIAAFLRSGVMARASMLSVCSSTRSVGRPFRLAPAGAGPRRPTASVRRRDYFLLLATSTQTTNRQVNVTTTHKRTSIQDLPPLGEVLREALAHIGDDEQLLIVFLTGLCEILNERRRL